MPKASNGYDGNGCLNLSGTCFSFKTMKLNLLGANKSSLHRMMLRDKHVNFLTPTISLTNPLWPLFPNFVPTIIEANLPPKLDSYSKWIRQKCYQFFIKAKLKQIFHFLTCILPNYLPHEIAKEFWKNSHFENMTAGFSLSCQNSLRWNTPEKMHFQEWHFLFSPIFPL